MKFPFQTWFWINRRILYIEIPFSYIKLFNWENIGYVAYPPEALFWSFKEDKYIHCRWMTSFVYLRNLPTSDIPISGFPGWTWRFKFTSSLSNEHSQQKIYLNAYANRYQTQTELYVLNKNKRNKIFSIISSSRACAGWSGYVYIMCHKASLSLSTLGKIFQQVTYRNFLLIFPDYRILHFMLIVSSGDNLHQIWNPVIWEK